MFRSASAFFIQAAENPVLALTAALILAVLLVNGWTDAPNAIAAAVSSGALRFRRAAALAAVCNVLGILGMTAVNNRVALTLYSIVRFEFQPETALSTLCAALCGVVLWSVLAWRFGIPTSESHALAAGLTGAALAGPEGGANVCADAWRSVIVGLVLSLLLGWLAGRWCDSLTARIPFRTQTFSAGQIVGAAAMAFFHGAQDGQKFMGVFLLGCTLAGRGGGGEVFQIPLWVMLLCAGVMALGTALGGRRIVERVGRDMVRLSARRGFAADLGGGLCLLVCTLLGLPVSTTHVRTAAVLGAGGAEADLRVAREILLTWLMTFPGCGLLGFFLARLFHPFF